MMQPSAHVQQTLASPNGIMLPVDHRSSSSSTGSRQSLLAGSYLGSIALCRQLAAWQLLHLRLAVLLHKFCSLPALIQPPSSCRRLT